MNVRRIGLAAFAASTGLLILAPMALSAQDEERRRAVGDWLVEDVFDDNGGRILRMTRESGDYRLDYHLNLGGGLPEDLSQASSSGGSIAARAERNHSAVARAASRLLRFAAALPTISLAATRRKARRPI